MLRQQKDLNNIPLIIRINLIYSQKRGIISMLHKFNKMQSRVILLQGIVIPFFVTHLHSEFDKNANSQYVSVLISIFALICVATNRGLRFLCVGSGRRTFYIF